MEDFFFGDTESTLKKIYPLHNEIIISGIQNGYSYENNSLIYKINSSNTDILVVGLGSPKQENWVEENKKQLNVKIILVVGEGLKVFANTKIRGPKVVRNIGLEWMVRLLSNPSKLWRRYIVGIPLFLGRVLIQKFRSIVKLR